jgi:hypothetical protein
MVDIRPRWQSALIPQFDIAVKWDVGLAEVAVRNLNPIIQFYE